MDGARQWFKSRVGLDVTETPRHLSFCAHGILEPEEVLVVPDATQDARFAENELVAGEMGVRFYAGAPLVMEDGLALGSLCVIDRRAREFTDEQRTALRTLARQVVSQIQLRRKNFELQQARVEREEFFNRPLDMLCIAGADGFFKLLNPAFSETLGFSTEELLARPLFDFVHPADVPATHAAMARVLSGLPVISFEHRFLCKDGSYRHLNWKCAPAADGMLYASARDVTDARRAEENERIGEERLRQAVRCSGIGIFDHDHLADTLYWSPEQRAILGWTSEEDIRVADYFSILHPEDRDIVVDAVRAAHDPDGEGVFDIDYRVIRRGDHAVRWLATRSWTFFEGEGTSRRPVRTVGALLDVTERHEAEERMKASLEEKETLLKEVHHRVKNNLQVITSLLQLQSDGLAEPLLLALFREAQDRVRAMALVHESLYRSGNLDAVNFGSHVEELAQTLLRSYSTGVGIVRLEAQTEPVELDIDVAVPLSLIVNELVTNAFKYAFANGRGGVLRVIFRECEDGALFLSIGDDGPGLPPDSAPEKSPSLGLKVVRTLAGQIGGRFEILREQGAVFTLTFPRSRKPPLSP